MLGLVAFVVLLLILYYLSSSLVVIPLVAVGSYFSWRVLYLNKSRSSLYPLVREEDVVVPGHHFKKRKVGVVGAGAGGLAAVKELVSEGHDVTCFEHYASFGGVFYYSHEKGGVYDNTLLTISNYFMAFSDFPPPEGEKYKFWHHKQYYSYLQSYVSHFKLLEKAQFHFHTKVVHMEQQSSGKWSVEVSTNGKTSVHEFDGIVVASGAHQIPAPPHSLDGIEYSKSTSPSSADSLLCVHSDSYKNAKGDPRFQDKKVVCVGAGETGVDLAYEVSLVSKQAYISMKRTPMVIPRFSWNLGQPSDIHTSRAMLYCNHRYISALHHFDQVLKYYTAGPLGQKIFKGVGGLGDPRMGKIADLTFRSGGNVTDQFLTKNCNFISSLLDKKLLERPIIKSIKGRTVNFADGSKEENVDTVLFCTGYLVDFPFLSKLELPQGPRSLYKHMFHPNLGSSIAFVGFARPTSGGVPATAEIQARYFALIMSGSRRLPPAWKEMIAADAAMENKQFFLTALKSVVFYGEYMESLAQHIRCSPDLWSYFWSDPLLWLHLQYGPMICAQYRLKGPHANPTLVKKVIKSISLCTPIPFSIAQSVASFLSWVGGALCSYRPPSW